MTIKDMFKIVEILENNVLPETDYKELIKLLNSEATTHNIELLDKYIKQYKG